LTSVTASIANMAAMKRYVGAAKMLPDSRMPRRLPSVISTIAPTQKGTVYGSRRGNALVR